MWEMKALVVQLLPHRESVWRDVVIFCLALLSAGLLVLELSTELFAPQAQLLYTVDFIIAMLFLADFGYELSTATHKRAYLKKNWYLLLASIPITGGMYQALRSIQLIRLLRVVRLYARIRRMSEATERVSKDSSRYIFIALFGAIVIFVGSTGFFVSEVSVNPQITTYFDALWWAVVTATSVGYGDIYPITTAGRLVAMVLMVFGIALLGAVVGLASNYFLREDIRNDK